MISRVRWRPGRRASRSVGIVANEFFDIGLGRMGGFGWAARTSAECLTRRPELGYRPLLLAGHGGIADGATARRTNGTRLLRFEDGAGYAKRLARANVSILLTIDYRPNYRPVLEARPELPVVVWVRDPRSPGDVDVVATLEVPGDEKPPLGVDPIDCTELGRIVERAGEMGTTIALASPAPLLATQKAPATYGIAAPEIRLLPNPLPVVEAPSPKSERPLVAFVGRLDPVKRPWVFVELARRFPALEFVLLGQAHFAAPGGWAPSRVPANLRALGHVGHEAKTRLLSSAWMLVNTSIHEALPISFLEALHCGTPIVACHDPERVASRFGVDVGRFGGSGLDALDPFSAAIERLLDDDGLRSELGERGRAWVRATHTRERFVTSFAALAGSIVGAD